MKKFNAKTKYSKEQKYRELIYRGLRIGGACNPDKFTDEEFKAICKVYKIVISIEKVSELKQAILNSFVNKGQLKHISEYFRVNDYDPIAEGQLEQLSEQVITAKERGDDIFFHCQSGCGRTGNFMIAAILILDINDATLEELENWDLERVCPVTVEEERHEERPRKTDGLGSLSIQRAEKLVTSYMVRPEDTPEKKKDNPIENNEQLDALVAFEATFVAKMKTKKLADLKEKLLHACDAISDKLDKKTAKTQRLTQYDLNSKPQIIKNNISLFVKAINEAESS